MRSELRLGRICVVLAAGVAVVLWCCEVVRRSLGGADTSTSVMALVSRVLSIEALAAQLRWRVTSGHFVGNFECNE